MEGSLELNHLVLQLAVRKQGPTGQGTKAALSCSNIVIIELVANKPKSTGAWG